ncbi:MAG: Imm42 family immunity protein [Neisseria sp.]|uniref:Imm42 family immunity protein n=1 Tax=Neisseria sp. TaxID=192066 RepID=UPI0026DB56B4|nr:Imm42 family immunity protein [Neisseria sp.]MDO4640996.1 Imm42 family immunity protein [Neisseria sp.]
MIIGDNMEFFIQYDVLFDDPFFPLGPLNLWINGKAYPGKGPNITLSSDMPDLIAGFKGALKYNFKQTNLPLDKIDFLDEEYNQTNLLVLTGGELWDNGLSTLCEIVGETFRLFYSYQEGSYELIELPLAYCKRLTEELEKELDRICPPRNYDDEPE